MSDVTRAELFEALERRVLLTYNPASYPDIGDLASPSNTVIRFNTDVGFIDIELFDVTGPDGGTSTSATATANNFLNYIRAGAFDGTFFHRMEALNGVNGQPPEILQGGGFTFTDADGITQVESDDPIVNEFDDARSNIARTLAMAKLGGDPDSATHQFFFNLVDNSGVLDDTNLDDAFDNGGFTVFGRVADDASWSNMMVITGLTNFNFADVQSDVNGDETMPLTPLPNADPLSFAFTDVPIDMPVMNVPPGELRFGLMNEDAIVTITDVEVIKTVSSNEFLTRNVYYPEGFANDNITETITFTNLDANEAISYQVIVRYETGTNRDQVIAFGELAPNATRTILVHDGANPVANPVKTNIPYAFEIQATSAVASIAASLTHTDFGNTVSEQFLSDQNYNNTELMDWAVTTVEKRDGEIRSFVVWQNVTDIDTTVEAVFYDANQDGAEHAISFELGGFRRGGINVAQIDDLVDGVYAVRVLADRPLMVAHTQYETLPNFGALPVLAQNADTTIGAAGGGTSALVLPSITLTSGGTAEIRVFNPGNQTVAIDVMGSRGDATSFQIGDGQGGGLLSVPAKTVRLIQLQTLITNNVVSDGEVLTITLSAITPRPFTAQFRSTLGTDQLASNLLGVQGQVTHFSGVFHDPDDSGVTDTISIFNPKVSGLIRYRIDVLFANGERINGTFQNLVGFGRVDLTVNDLPNAAAVINRIEGDPLNTTFAYSIAVIDPNAPANGAGLIQLTRVDANLGFVTTTMGRYTGTETDLTDIGSTP